MNEQPCESKAQPGSLAARFPKALWGYRTRNLSDAGPPISTITWTVENLGDLSELVKFLQDPYNCEESVQLALEFCLRGEKEDKRWHRCVMLGSSHERLRFAEALSMGLSDIPALVFRQIAHEIKIGTWWMH